MAISAGAAHKDRLRHAARESLLRLKELAIVLSKTVLPYFICAEILKESGVLEVIASYMAPIMGLWNLPGEASAVLVVGMLISPYAAAAVIVPLGLEANQITVLGFIVTVAHALPVEGAIVRELVPGSFWSLTLLRVTVAMSGGWLLAQVML